MVVTLLLLACRPSDGEPSDRTPFTLGSDDTGDVVPPPPTDVDADGWTEKDGDCDDADPAVYPGAYDRPDDGIDADCVDGDRTCDCLVLDADTTAVETYEGIDTTAFRSVDIAYLLDTTCGSLGPQAVAESFPDVADALEASVTTRTVGLATFDDFAYWPFGDVLAGDKPFRLLAQQTDDVTAVQDALSRVAIHAGADGTEAAIEGLYQALTGAGYDQDCDATYDDSTDVKPFVADAADPFGGTAGQSYDATDQSTGSVGGMGFREDSTVRVIVYVTNNQMRDPSAGDPSPGGCPGDARADDVAVAALEDGVYLFGIAESSTLPVEQMLALADATGSVADLDGDGAADDPLVYQWKADETIADFGAAIVRALEAVDAEAGLLDVYASVTLEVRDDPLGIVSTIWPAEFHDVAWTDIDELEFNVEYDARAYGTEPVVGSVELALVGDGFDLATVHVDIEIAPL